MSPTPAPGALRAARRALGWSLTEAANRIVARAAEQGVPVATTRSLRSQLSRWENGHATPEPTYRALLAELLGHSAITLGIDPPPPATSESSLHRLRAALAEASAIDGPAIALWREQLMAAHRLDADLGTAAAGGIVLALVNRLDRLLAHTVLGQARTAVAEILSGAEAMAGTHALDRGDHDVAWCHYEGARVAAREALSPSANAVATAGLVDVLVDAGEFDSALALLAEARAALTAPPDLGEATADRPRTDQPAEDQSVTLARLAGATALAHAAAGRAAEALAALAEAEAACRTPGLPQWRDNQPADRSVIVDRFHRPEWPIELVDIRERRGRALVLLRDTAAEPELRQALAAGPHSIRHRAALLADLAAALADHDPAGSAAHAREARSIALRIDAPRIAARLPGPGGQ